MPDARRLADINYDEMLEMASEGARVMHNRAVELGWVYDVPILVASSLTDKPTGTRIHGGELMENRNKVRGIAHDAGIARVTLLGVPDRPGIAAQVFSPLADAGISVDIIVQNAGQHGLSDLSSTVTRDQLAETLERTRAMQAELGATDVTADEYLAKVSIVGAGLTNAPGYAGAMFRALRDAQVNIEMITTAEISITCVVHQDSVEDAVRALHRAFSLETPDEIPL